MVIVRRIAMTPSGEILVFFAVRLAHFRLGVALGDEPRANAGRYLTNTSAGQPVELDAVQFVFPRCFLYSDLHIRTKGDRITVRDTFRLFC